MEATQHQLYVFNKIKEDAAIINPAIAFCGEVQPIIERKHVRTRLIRCHIPTDLHNSFLRDLEELGFIESSDKFHIKLLK